MAVEEDKISLKDYFDQRIADARLHFEARIDNLERNLKSKDEARVAALKMATDELERRLADLNHAHRNAADALRTYLPRELWDKFREDDAVWKSQAEVLRATNVSQNEFRIYKETTQQALTMASGKEEGISNTWSIIVIGFSILAAIGTAITGFGVFFHSH